jgi:hypothetical protein
MSSESQICKAIACWVGQSGNFLPKNKKFVDLGKDRRHDPGCGDGVYPRCGPLIRLTRLRFTGYQVFILGCFVTCYGVNLLLDKMSKVLCLIKLKVHAEVRDRETQFMESYTSPPMHPSQDQIKLPVTFFSSLNQIT